MPAIFNDEKRKQLRINLMENGFKRIKCFGLKRTSIEEIAKDAGIAKGTFYHFFPSKEEFVASIISYKREGFKREIEVLVSESGGLTKECARKILKRIAYGDDNLYTYLTAEDFAVLAARAPKSIIPMEEDVAITTGALLNLIPDKRPDCDWQVIANYVKIMVLAVINREMLLEGAVDKSIDGIISLIIDCIYLSNEDEIIKRENEK